MVFLVCSGNLLATNYYISSSSGADSNPGTSSALPWRSLSKLNASMALFVPGDSILFKRGDVFMGSVSITRSGTASSRIVFSAYGTGARPVISGFFNPPTWTNSGNGIWQTNIPYNRPLNTVFFNGSLQAKGRYPNIIDSSGGYLYYESVNSTTPSITDANAPATSNWTGADVVIRKNSWILDICKVTAYNNGTITYVNPAGVANTYYGINGYGYFFQNDIRTLDRSGEWFFDAATGNLSLFNGASSPAGVGTRVSVTDTVFSIGNQQGITVENLTVEGANQYGFYAKNGRDISLVDCQVTNCGRTGIYVFNVPNILVEKNEVNNCLNCGILVYNQFASPSLITGNRLKRIALLPGMGESGDTQYIGVAVTGNNLTVEYNYVDSCGYNAIDFDGNNVSVRNNSVSNFCMAKNDGGGIYTYGGGGTQIRSNRSISNNIILNAIGPLYGTPPEASEDDVRGIYLDGAPNNVKLTGNSIARIRGGGIYLNSTSNVDVTGNVVFDTKVALSLQRYPGSPLMRTTKVFRNNFFPLFPVQKNIEYWNGDLNNPSVVTIQQDMRAIGSLDSNIYRDDVTMPFDWFYHTSPNTNYTDPAPANLEGWKGHMAMEPASRTAPGPLINSRISRFVTTNAVANGTFTSTLAPTYFWAPNNAYTTAIDNTGKIDGTPCLKLTPTAPSSDFTLMYAPVGNVTTTKKYLLRFQTLGTSVNGVLNAGIRMTNAPYDNLMTLQKCYFGMTVAKHEVLITAPAAAVPASYIIEVQQSSGVTYIDNVEFFEVETSTINVVNNIRFEYNDSRTPRTLSLDGTYYGVDAVRYQGNLTLQPYTSIILIRDSVLSMPASTLSASTSATAINCNGGNATVTVTGSGGTAPYTGTGTFTRSAGTHNFTVTDAAGASVISTVTITQPAPLVVTVTSGTITVNGGSTTVTVSASGGTAPYSGTGTFTVTAGTYSYTVTDARGCTGTQSITISQPSPLLASSSSATAVNCNGGTSTVTVSASGGTPPYMGTGSFSRTAGTYSFTVTDAAGASAVSSVTITQPTAVAVSLSSGRITVNGGSTTVTVSASGGTAPYTGTGTFTVTAGTYTYTVTDARGCSGTNTITVAQPTPLTASVSSTPINCNGGSSSVTVSATGGILPYTGTGAYSRTAGTYTFTVTDSVGTISSVSLTLTQPAILTATSSKTDVSCNGASTGSITLTVSGGTAPYSFNWGGGITTQNRTALAAGSYTCTITDARGCTASASQTITQPAALSVTSSKTDVSCNGASTGSITLTVSGGTAPYSFNWGGGITTQNRTTLAAGSYTCTITDARGCTASASQTITQPSALTAGNPTAPAITSSGGTTTITQPLPTGGTAPYQYQLGSGAFQSGNTFSGVIAGTYTITIRDGCNALITRTITIAGQQLNILDNLGLTASLPAAVAYSLRKLSSGYSGPVLQIRRSSDGELRDVYFNGSGVLALNSAVSAAGGGAATATTLGTWMGTNSGTVAIWFDQSGQGRHIAAAVENQPVIVQSGTILSNGTGKPRVQFNGSTTYLTSSSFVPSAQPVSLAAVWQTVSAEGELCGWGKNSGAGSRLGAWVQNINGAAARFGMEAGGPYLYGGTLVNVNDWNVTNQVVSTSSLSSLSQRLNGASQTITGTDGTLNITASGSEFAVGTIPAARVQGLNGSIQELVVFPSVLSDADRKIMETNQRNYYIPPPPLVVSATATSITCNGGNSTVTVTATGGTAPYTGTGTLSRTAGSHTFTVTDAAGVTANATITITQPAAIAAGAPSAPAITSVNGTTTITQPVPTGGTSPYQYQLGTGVFQTGNTFSNIAAGSYTITVRDANQCTTKTNITIAAFVPPLTATATATAINCNGGSSTVTVSASGGTPPYSGTGSFSRVAGTYSFTVTDINGVKAVASIIVVQPPSLAISCSSGTITINGGTTTVTVNASGGTAPYTGTGAFTVTAGTYTYTVRDANGCTASQTVTITQPAVLTATSSATAISCNGGVATITVAASGGVAPYTGTGVFTARAGTYNYTVRDASGAQAVTSIIINQPSLLVATASAGVISTNGGSTTLTVSATGGKAPYTGTGVFTVTAGTYSYTVTDASGCSDTASVIVTQPSSLFTASASTRAVNCFAGSTQVTVAGLSGVAPYGGTGTFTVSPGKGSMRLDINNPEPANTVLNYWSIGSISNTKRYVFRVSTRGTTANGSFKAYFRQTISPWGDLSTIQTATYGTAVTHHQFFINNPTTQADASFVIEVQQNSGTTFFDNIAVYELDTAGNLVGTNKYAFGEFETGANNVWSWSPSQNHVRSWDTSYRIPARKNYTVTDASGKSAVASVFITQPAAPLSASSSFVAGVGNTFKVTVNGSGGTPPYAGTGTYDVAAGSYTYQITDAGGCTASTTIQVSALQKPGNKSPVQTTNGSGLSAALDVRLYPNPSSGSFRLLVRGGIESQTRYQVHTAEGRLLEQNTLPSHGTLELGSAWIPGIYFIRLFNGDSSKTVKAVKGSF